MTINFYLIVDGKSELLYRNGVCLRLCQMTSRVGAFVAMAIIGHAMFVNTPADASDDARSARPPINAD